MHFNEKSATVGVGTSGAYDASGSEGVPREQQVNKKPVDEGQHPLKAQKRRRIAKGFSDAESTKDDGGNEVQEPQFVNLEEPVNVTKPSTVVEPISIATHPSTAKPAPAIKPIGKAAPIPWKTGTGVPPPFDKSKDKVGGTAAKSSQSFTKSAGKQPLASSGSKAHSPAILLLMTFGCRPSWSCGLR